MNSSMIEVLYQNITAGLKEIKPDPVYQEELPQDFKQPSFLIVLQKQTFAKGINQRLRRTVEMDVSYYPKESADAAKECWSVGESLFREMNVNNFKIKKRNLQIVDGILHFTFQVDFREYLESNMAEMQIMSQNVEMEEEQHGRNMGIYE